jgi:hypothetical protein
LQKRGDGLKRCAVERLEALTLGRSISEREIFNDEGKFP